jgi:hypothetical protein
VDNERTWIRKRIYLTTDSEMDISVDDHSHGVEIISDLHIKSFTAT